MRVPDVLRTLAGERGWSLAELAKQCDISVDTVRSLASRPGASPSLRTVRKLARGTGKPLTDVIGMFDDADADDRATAATA